MHEAKGPPGGGRMHKAKGPPGCPPTVLDSQLVSLEGPTNLEPFKPIERKRSKDRSGSLGGFPWPMPPG